MCTVINKILHSFLQVALSSYLR
uniref:Uncharacterized protein n=1 Tax=Rhizophora mucronata TaxID=61149 RepID=A0A2P2PZH3_RHIMU